MVVAAATDDKASTELATLLDEFRPFLDESLILAIVGDHDLNTDVDVARSTLKLLASDAEKEETSTFNPSGVIPDAFISDSVDQRDSVLGSGSTDGSPQFSSITSDSCPDSSRTEYSGEMQDIADDDKAATLISMFPDMKPFDVTFELQRVNGDFEKAMSALLNRQYLEEAGELQRGTLATAESSDSRGRRKGKSKKKAAAQGGVAKSNLRVDVAYTLKPLSLDKPDDSPSELASPMRSPSYSPLVGPGVASLSPKASSRPPAQPVNPTDWQTVSPKKTLASRAGLYNLAAQDESSTALREAAGRSFDEAHSNWRRGRSDPLFRSAAVVYAERGHSQVAAAQARQRADFEDLVNRQSAGNPYLIDLHGVPVREGVEIARSRTRRWWQLLAETEEDGIRAAAKRKPFVIVTGKGKHSVGGVSKLRQSVGVALARDGWHVEVQTGQFVVYGQKKV